MIWSIGDRVTVVSATPGTDSAVRVHAAGKTGKVTELEEHSVFPYRVDFDNGGWLWFAASELEPETKSSDPVNHPDHYTWLPIEAIEITRHFDFVRGNALKYLLRAGRKGDVLQDLRKARWYLDDEIRRLENEEAACGES
ncbi:DUF3310 domain-containing protein [Kitasatospora sp. NPDC088556]|uniref:DUF3310 domain-containing protein n=1 Tax=Kitasatospora sp. NPDC088556 TaxID=3364076 RepID=UPI003821C774